ncbi:hypothetical protein N8351_00225 [Flavobacteriaceae bacterium]|nr:hypothetical protein [Flavobacteriaceae bacterium]
MDYGVGSINTVRFNYNDNIKFEFFAPIMPFLFAPYLVFFFDKLKKNLKFLINAANVFILIMGLITLSRSVILGAIIPYLLFYGYKFFRFKFKLVKLLVLSLVISVISIAVYQSAIIEKSGIAALSEGISARDKVQNIRGGNSSYERFKEANDYFNQDLTFSEYLIGRGVGGHKVRNDSASYIGGVNMMHFGPLHVFLKGGILLVLILYIPAFLAIVKFWKTPDYHISLILLLFLITNFITTTWSWSYNLFFYWYGISIYYESKRYNKISIKG